MSAGLFSSDASTEDLEQAFDDNAQPFSSLAQVERFIRAATLLKRRDPEEFETRGQRQRMQSLQPELDAAVRWRAVYLSGHRRTRATSFGGVD